MNGALLRHAWRANRSRLIVVSLALALWGALNVVIYDSLGDQVRAILESGAVPPEFARFAQFGGGDFLSLTGAVALGFIHPIAVALQLMFAVGFAASAVAGEHQRGTLEVLLARPLARRTVWATLAAAAALFVATTVAALTAGVLLGAVATGRTAELGLANLPLQWLNTSLVFWAIAAVSLAASVSFDRLAPAVGISLAIVLVAYTLEVLGSLWPEARPLQPYSLFHYLDTKANLIGLPHWGDLAKLGAVSIGAAAYALMVFPRRDLAAPA